MHQKKKKKQNFEDFELCPRALAKVLICALVTTRAEFWMALDMYDPTKSNTGTSPNAYIHAIDIGHGQTCSHKIHRIRWWDRIHTLANHRDRVFAFRD